MSDVPTMLPCGSFAFSGNGKGMYRNSNPKALSRAKRSGVWRQPHRKREGAQ
jgi:hypothetical protein